MYTPTKSELKELGFKKENQYWYSFVIDNYNEYPIKFYIGSDGHKRYFLLLLSDVGDVECECNFYPKSFDHLKQIINAFKE